MKIGDIVWPKWTTPRVQRGSIVALLDNGHLQVEWRVAPGWQAAFELLRDKNHGVSASHGDGCGERRMRHQQALHRLPMVNGGTSIILASQCHKAISG